MATITVERFGRGKMLDPNRARAVVKSALDKVAKDVKADYKATMATWKKQKTEPVVANQGEETRLIYVPNKIFGYVDSGTRPQVIRPKTARMLAFRGGFTAKTQPGVIGSGPGWKSGVFTYAREVRHPGIKKRGWSELLAKKHKKTLASTLDSELGKL